MTIRVAINGFGRIGRQIARTILDEHNATLRLVAVNTLEDLDTSAFLFNHDSTLTIKDDDVAVVASGLRINGQTIRFFRIRDPSSIGWHRQDVDVVIECSGAFTTGDRVRGHLTAGVRKVIVTAAASCADVTICFGVNNEQYLAENHHVISGSSCTTNCLGPVVKTISRNFGIKIAMATFLHSYTGGQPVLDSFCRDLRRSRAAHVNIIPTSTSAESQLPLVVPELAGRFQANAIRVPTPIVHLADLCVQLQRPTSTDEFISTLAAAADQELKGIMTLSAIPTVSIDLRGSHSSSVVDINNIYLSNDLVKLLVWHDNEVSYCHRIVDLIAFIGDF